MNAANIAVRARGLKSRVARPGMSAAMVTREQTTKQIMKNKLHVLLCIAAISVATLRAADGENKSGNAEQRLRETDLALTLHQYERVQMEAFEARLQIDLLDTEGQTARDERKTKIESLERRIAIFQKRAEQLRIRALELGEAGTRSTEVERERAKLKVMRDRFSADHPGVKAQEERVQALEAKAK